MGTGAQTSLRQVVAVARRALRILAEPAWGSMPNRAWDTNTWVADNRVIRQALAWKLRHSFAAGFERMAGWLAKRSDMLRRYRPQ